MIEGYLALKMHSFGSLGGFNMKTKLKVLMMGLILSSATFADYGAIAYSDSTGQWGSSYGFFDRNTAFHVALSHCGVADCEIKVWAQNQCAALAVGSFGIYGWGVHPFLNPARDRALSECFLRADDCYLVADICT